MEHSAVDIEQPDALRSRLPRVEIGDKAIAVLDGIAQLRAPRVTVLRPGGILRPRVAGGHVYPIEVGDMVPVARMHCQVDGRGMLLRPLMTKLVRTPRLSLVVRRADVQVARSSATVPARRIVGERGPVHRHAQLAERARQVVQNTAAVPGVARGDEPVVISSVAHVQFGNTG